MPKKGKGSRHWRQQDFKGHFKPEYYDHDDRERHGGNDINDRRVSFKKGNRIAKQTGRRELGNIRDRLLLDDDFQMSGEGSSHRNSFQRGGQPRHGKGGRAFQAPGKGRLNDQTGWFKVIILNGASYDKQILMGSLKSFVSPVELIPIYFQVEDHDSFFYLDDLKAAEAALSADRQITLNGENRIVIKVIPITPKAALTDRLKERIKMVMVSRFNKDTKALDLSRLHIDPELIEDSCCAVSRPPVMTVILDVISEHIPELQALNLDHNLLSVTETLSSLPRKAPNLQILYLGKNRFYNINNLSVIKGLPLLELKLEGNPLCKKFDSKVAYQSALQKLFPKLARLDGADLTPAIGFELDEKKTKIPESHSSFLCVEEGKTIVTQFVQQYFALYDAVDSTSRQALMDAYHESAVFSLTTVYTSQQGGPANISRLNAYLTHSRNLKRNSDSEKREALIKKGKVSIAGLLTELPRSQHDPASFTLDLSIYSPVMIVFTLTGVFKEPDTKCTPLRHFFRKFILIPVGPGFSIVNDMLFVTHATPLQIKNSFSTPTVVLSVPAAALVTSQPPAQLEIVHSLTAQSGMNMEWSRKCLEETSWDLQRAMAAFTKLNQDGKIPPEAFAK